MNAKVALYKRVETEKGLRFCPVVELKNNRIKAHAVVVDGVEERHEEGAYYLSWYVGKKVVRVSVGNDPVEAANRRAKKQAEFTARAAGVAVVTEVQPVNGRRLLTASITDFLAGTDDTKSPKTKAAYTKSLDYFTESCSKLYLEDIDRRDLQRFAAFLRDEELHPRTCWNKFSNVVTFLKANKVKVHEKGDWPKYTEEVPEIYEQEDLDALFKACDDDERAWFEFFLGTGCREQEVMFMHRCDVNLATATVSVKHKPGVWSPKAYKERHIPMSDSLVARLKARKAASNGHCELLFPTAGCKPKLDFLDCLKAVATRAGLDKDEFWLHKFRATFATRLLRALNGDFASAQKVLGHSDVQSTMRYWRPADNQAIREAINRASAGV
jgi:integrase/recombinase XerD